MLAVQGFASVAELAEQTGVSRVTAHRDVELLRRAGLVGRWRSDEDRTHTWLYEVTPAGTAVVERELRRSGRLVPLELGRRLPGAVDFFLFQPLTALAVREPQRCSLFQRLGRLDAAAWLRQHGVDGLRADGYGVWIEDGRVVRFLVHVDPGSREHSYGVQVVDHGLDGLLAGYRSRGVAVPVGVVLVIAADAEREDLLLQDLAAAPPRTPVAVTTSDLVRDHGPVGPVWRPLSGREARLRLIDLAP